MKLIFTYCLLVPGGCISLLHLFWVLVNWLVGGDTDQSAADPAVRSNKHEGFSGLFRPKSCHGGCFASTVGAELVAPLSRGAGRRFVTGGRANARIVRPQHYCMSGRGQGCMAPLRTGRAKQLGYDGRHALDHSTTCLT